MNYEVVYSKRKTIGLQINKDSELIVRAPFKTQKKVIDEVIIKNKLWIEKNIEKMKNNIENNIAKDLSEYDIECLKKEAEEILQEKVKKYSEITNLIPSKIRISNAKTIWGSCNYKNIISFSYRVVLLDEELIDYIVLHELVHIKIKNHRNEFYQYLKKYMPDYKDRIIKLKNINII